MADYGITIRMSGETVEALTQLSFFLYGFKAVQGFGGNGAPTVWFSRGNLLQENVVRWQNACRAYTSGSEIVPNTRVVVSNSYDVAPGQALVVTSSAGTGTVQPGGSAGAISVINQTPMYLTSGIAQAADGTYSPVGAFPLFGLSMDLFVPVEQVFLMLSPNLLDSGTVVYQAPSPGLMIDLAGESARAVWFDVYDGWSWADDAGWARTYPAYTELAPLLVQPLAAPEVSGDEG